MEPPGSDRRLHFVQVSWAVEVPHAQGMTSWRDLGAPTAVRRTVADGNRSGYGYRGVFIEGWLGARNVRPYERSSDVNARGCRWHERHECCGTPIDRIEPACGPVVGSPAAQETERRVAFAHLGTQTSEPLGVTAR